MTVIERSACKASLLVTRRTSVYKDLYNKTLSIYTSLEDNILENYSLRQTFSLDRYIVHEQWKGTGDRGWG